MGRGVTKWVGGHVKFYPYKKRGGGGAEKVLAMLKGWQVIVFPLKLEVLAIGLLKGEARKCSPFLEGGGGAQKVSDPEFSHFVAQHPHN